MEACEREANEDFSRGTLGCHLADNFGDKLLSFFSVWLRDDGNGRGSNLTAKACRYLEANAGTLRMKRPCVPLSGRPDSGNVGVGEALAHSPERAVNSLPCLIPKLPSPA